LTRVALIRSAEGVAPAALSSTVPTLPLGLAYIAATAAAAGHDVSVVDAVGESPSQLSSGFGITWLGLTNEEVADRIDAGTEIIGIGTMFTHNWPMVRELTRLVRKRHPDTPIVVGGEHATALPEFVLQESPVDVCVMGEGEETFTELVPALRSGRDLAGVAGIAYRAPDGSVRRNPRRARIHGVDEIPTQAWEYFDVSAYSRCNLTNGLQIGDAPPTIPILATRGCPYQCTFCTSPNMWTTRYVTRDPKLVVDEIESYVRRYGAKNFPFQDLTAIVQKKWTREFCQEIIDRGLDIHWQFPSGTRSEAVDDEVAALLRRSGMAHMAYAPESGSRRIREAIRKQVKDEPFFESVRAATAAGLHVQTFFIMGFPEDRIRDLAATVAMLVRLSWMGVEDMAVSHYMPYPGSAMHARLLESGKVDLSDRWLVNPLRSHSAWVTRETQVNENFPPWVQVAFALLAYSVFYGVSAIRKPRYFYRMLTGIFLRPGTDVSRLQRALKNIIRTKPKFGAIEP